MDDFSNSEELSQDSNMIEFMDFDSINLNLLLEQPATFRLFRSGDKQLIDMYIF